MRSVYGLVRAGIHDALHACGVELTRYESNREVAQLKNIFGALVELAQLEKAAPGSEEVEFLVFAQKHLHNSRSQILQDLFVLYELREKKNGFFVEFGATNGVDSSNSYALEKDYAWDGILAEPGRKWHAALRASRRSHIDQRCVWSETGHRLVFNEVAEPELSTIDMYSSTDRYGRARGSGDRYDVETVSLNDLLRENRAPSTIDYLSIDTEGSEFDILRAFDFDKYSVSVITCEHNYSDAREKIWQLLTSKGYRRKFEALSAVDDWYVRGNQ
jgi:FkbM family methyltransferase